MSMSLCAEDPSPYPVQPSQVQQTLSRLREEPARGRAVVCELDRQTVGYALLISFWSNELVFCPINNFTDSLEFSED
jgi:hypothetical protein